MRTLAFTLRLVQRMSTIVLRHARQLATPGCHLHRERLRLIPAYSSTNGVFDVEIVAEYERRGSILRHYPPAAASGDCLLIQREVDPVGGGSVASIHVLHLRRIVTVIAGLDILLPIAAIVAGLSGCLILLVLLRSHFLIMLKLGLPGGHDLARSCVICAHLLLHDRDDCLIPSLVLARSAAGIEQSHKRVQLSLGCANDADISPASLFKQPALAGESGEIMVGAAHPYPDLLFDEEAPILIFEAGGGGGTSARSD